jgi:hypothetical protein
LIGGVPAVGVGHAGDGKTIRRIALAVTDDGVDLAQLVRIVPRTVVGVEFAGDEEIALADFRGSDAEAARITEAADRDLREGLVDEVDEIDVQRARRGEIAFVGVIGTLAEIRKLKSA